MYLGVPKGKGSTQSWERWPRTKKSCLTTVDYRRDREKFSCFFHGLIPEMTDPKIYRQGNSVHLTPRLNCNQNCRQGPAIKALSLLTFWYLVRELFTVRKCGS